MRENRTYGSEGGESRRLFSTPINTLIKKHVFFCENEKIE